MRKLILWDAIIAWRDDILRSDFYQKKKIHNLSHMTKLIEAGVVELDQPLSEFLKAGPGKSIEILKTLDLPDSTRRARTALILSLHKFAAKKKIKQTDIPPPFQVLKDAQRNVISEILSSNVDKAKLLKRAEIVRFTRELCNLNARDSLICWMMWEFQCTIHEILNISINDIDFLKGIIKFKDGNLLGEIRADLKPCILAQKKEKSGTDLLFTTENGKGIHPGQVVRNMKIASKRAKLRFIFSPKLLYADAKAYARRAFLSLPEEERTRICLKMATRD